MENVIRDHTRLWKTFSIIHPLKHRIVSYDKPFSSYTSSELSKWKYFINSECEGITRRLRRIYNDTVLSFFNDTSLIVNNRFYNRYRWDKMGKLIEESHNQLNEERSIKYIGKSKVVSVKYIIYLYDLKEYLKEYLKEDDEGPNFLRYYRQENLKKIANSNLDVVNLNLGTFFYIDKNGKVNSISLVNRDDYAYYYYNPIIVYNNIKTDEFIDYDHRSYEELRDRFNDIIRKEPSKLKREADKLLMNFRNYMPTYLFNYLVN